MTTATRPSTIVYVVYCQSWRIGEGKDREEAELVRAAHAERNNRDPLSGDYVIAPVSRKERD